jgi:hypothetical protein
MRNAMQYGPAAAQFKTLAAISGVLNEKRPEDTDKASGSPESQVIRERIKQLMRDKAVRSLAKDAGIDLDKMKDDG